VGPFVLRFIYNDIAVAHRGRLLRSRTEEPPVRVHFDEASDAVYVTVSDAAVVESEEVQPGIILDFDADKQVVAIEIPRVKQRVPLADLKRLQFEVA
jgi:uncharacterized protein YuzE